MPDEIDLAQAASERTLALAEAAARARAAEIPAGWPGDCELCGEWSGRLVGGVCAPCRDAHRLP